MDKMGHTDKKSQKNMMTCKVAAQLKRIFIDPFSQITQIECSSKRLAPNGCLQYFTAPESAATGTISSFNYNSGNGVLLANQEYTLCVRGERTYCSICYWQPTIATGFGLSYPNNAAIAGVDTTCG